MTRTHCSCGRKLTLTNTSRLCYICKKRRHAASVCAYYTTETTLKAEVSAWSRRGPAPEPPAPSGERLRVVKKP